MPKQSHYKMDFAFVSYTALPHQKKRRKVIHNGSSFRRFYPVRKGLQDVI